MVNGQITISNFSFLLMLLLGIALVGISAYLAMKLKSKVRETKEAQDKCGQLEGKFNLSHLESLESRIDPHLLKNILNSIQSHAYQTYFAIDKLANVLDYILYESRQKFVTPKEEIEFALELIEINKIKVSPLFDLKIKKNIQPNEPIYEQQLLAPLVSIDLIENAFKHADLQSGGAFIAITFEFKEGAFSITVANKISTRSPIRKSKKGTGLETLSQRLQILYRNNFQLDKFVEDDVFIAHLKINLLEYKAEMRAIG